MKCNCCRKKKRTITLDEFEDKMQSNENDKECEGKHKKFIESQFFCSECGKKLCLKCMLEHKESGPNHKTSFISQGNLDDICAICKKEESIVNYYCKQCGIQLCEECKVNHSKDEPSHKILNIEEIYDSENYNAFKEETTLFVERVEADRKSAEELISNLEDIIKEIKKIYKENTTTNNKILNYLNAINSAYILENNKNEKMDLNIKANVSKQKNITYLLINRRNKFLDDFSVKVNEAKKVIDNTLLSLTNLKNIKLIDDERQDINFIGEVKEVETIRKWNNNIKTLTISKNNKIFFSNEEKIFVSEKNEKGKYNNFSLFKNTIHPIQKMYSSKNEEILYIFSYYTETQAVNLQQGMNRMFFQDQRNIEHPLLEILDIKSKQYVSTFKLKDDFLSLSFIPLSLGGFIFCRSFSPKPMIYNKYLEREEDKNDIYIPNGITGNCSIEFSPGKLALFKNEGENDEIKAKLGIYDYTTKQWEAKETNISCPFKINGVCLIDNEKLAVIFKYTIDIYSLPDLGLTSKISMNKKEAKISDICQLQDKSILILFNSTTDGLLKLDQNLNKKIIKYSKRNIINSISASPNSNIFVTFDNSSRAVIWEY